MPRAKRETLTPKNPLLLSLVFCVLLIALDRATKSLASKSLSVSQSIPLLKNILHLTLVHNTGAAFGLFKNQTLLFIIISLIALPAMYLSFKTKLNQRQNRLTQLALLLVISGAIGNLIDRIAWGYVIDFIDFRIWPVFNVADSAISIGAVLLGYSLLKSKK